MTSAEDRGGLAHDAEETSFATRLAALSEYREIRERRRRGERRPGDYERHAQLRDHLERTGGIPGGELWHRGTKD